MAEEKGTDMRNVIVGAVIGVASILPGVSGGLIAVLCGIYERLIEDLSDLRHKLFDDFRFLLTIGIGLLIGMMGCAVVLDYTMSAFSMACMAFFFGLILAQIPEVYALSGHTKGSRIPASATVALILGLGLVGIMMYVNATGNGGVSPEDHSAINMVIFVICGILLAISKIMPGISGSSLLIALGLFDVTISSMAHLDMFFLAPLCVGLVIGVLGFAKVMEYCLRNYRTETYFLIMGLTVGSLMIIIQELMGMGPSVTDIVIAVIAGIAGVAVSYGFNVYGKRVKG
ncbi:MAG: DUF368 domain-containing protein [Candidatus Methanomethylophilaceae archaeon]